MKRRHSLIPALSLPLLLVAATPGFAADSAPKDDVAAAAKALAEKPNYSWTTTVEVPEGSQFRPGPTDGKTEKSGLMQVTMSFGDTPVHLVVHGDKGAATNRDGEWRSAAELENAEGPGRWLLWMLRGIQAPAAQAADILKETKSLSKTGDTCSGDLTEEGAKTLLSFRRRGGANQGPEIRNAKGTAKFWVKDGVLSKLQYKVSGIMNFNGEDRDLDRTTAIEIKNVGTTSLTVPEAAKKKLG